MTDLYELLNRAIDSQPDTPEARLAVYNHIRGLYERRRQEIDPNLSDAEIQAEQARLIREQASLETIIARIEAERTGAPPPPEETLSFDRFAADDTSAAGQDGGPQASADPRRGRPRVAVRREPREGGSSRRGIAIISVALVLAGIGVAAWWLRAETAPPVEEEPAVVEAPEENNNKITDRVGGAPPEEVPAPQDPQLPAQPSQQPPQQQAAPAETAGQQEIVAQRAFLFELDDQNTDQPKISAGQVVWRLEGKGTPSAVLYADTALPEAGLSFSMVIRPNDDATLPASHTIEIVFTNAADRPERVVRDVAVPQMRIDREPRGMPLAGLTIPVADNNFLVGLSNLQTDVARNYNLLRERDWVDLPVRFADGKIGTITFAKGAAGQQLITEATDSWR